jgi:pimeloyl-ACP methyl ester carboxylesterase
MRGREVLSIGYPEGFMGKMTDAFVEEIKTNQSFLPHAEFFGAAVRHLTDGQEIDLWGLSTGCAVAGYLLSDEAFQEQVRNAVLFAPAASVDQSKVAMGLGVIREMGSLAGNFDVLPHTVITTGRKEHEDDDQLKRRKVVFKALQTAVSKNCGVWDEMKVKEGGEITYVVGGRDHITKAYLAVDEFKQNPQADVILLPDAGHQTTMMDPFIMDRIFARQRTTQ